jgi:predicted ATPase
MEFGMSKAKLTSIELKGFKAFEQTAEIELRPLTVILGRNNSGKSSLIQSLLLLKQTLADPRPDVMLKLEGVVDAFNLRELTFGWPEKGDEVKGPLITLGWECQVDKPKGLSTSPDLAHLVKHSNVRWLGTDQKLKVLKTTLSLHTSEVHGDAKITRIELRSFSGEQETALDIVLDGSAYSCYWNGRQASKISVELDNFIPILSIDKKNLGPRNVERAYHNAYLVIFEQSLEALKSLLADFHYLGSARQPPPSLFKPATADPGDIGVSGEFAAQLLHRRKNDIVHFLPIFTISDEKIKTVANVTAATLEEAVNSVMRSLSIDTPLHIKDIENIGFQLMFGKASLSHVGRGLGQLLPMVELGLFSDPLRFNGSASEIPLEEYLERCASFGHIALEEPEAHLHPKVSSLLAHWLVSLSQSSRRVIVETHSDHLVRRLRGLIARAENGSDFEKWLLENVVILSVEQDENGRSSVSKSYLTKGGGLGELWPADFMDEASDEESAIYYAQMDKGIDCGIGVQDVSLTDEQEIDMDEAP